ncbi:MAG: EamA family transporter [Candidatus Eisenbacteria bacterium]|uniref:EamA family transporter n=1 Tax=Eiseniibacteriota bacterium TaxID=2212470 RepID=A0A956RMS7_UNCEI|nr:EamA family transporter [Candidatus Eisenbacteria bacterium]
MSPLLLVIIAVCFSVTGELCLKSGMDQIGVLSFSNLFPTLGRVLSNTRIWTGFAAIGVGAVFWLAVLSRVNLSWAYPMLSLGYILVLLFSALILREPVSALRWIGALVVVAGVFLITRT